MSKSITPALRVAALTALISGLAFSVSAQAASTTNLNTESTSQTTSTTTTMKKHGEMNVENRIKSLHDKLKITAAQEPEWTAVAEAMRDNETHMHELVQARHQSPESMTAVDDLESYQKITQAHADGLGKVISSFETLYGDMSDDQKKNADTVFGSFEGHGHTAKTNS